MKTRILLVTSLATLCFVVPAVAEPGKTLANTIEGMPELSRFVEFLKAADQMELLAADGPLTVFAPTNEAFEKIAGAEVKAVDPSGEDLVFVLRGHLVPRKVMLKDGDAFVMIETLNGIEALYLLEEEAATYHKSGVIKGDIECADGVLHLIDKVVFLEAKKR